MWLGFLLALPIPFVVLSTSCPFWGDALSLAAPLAWAAILGAAGRVAGLAADARHEARPGSSAVGRAHDAAMRRARADAAMARFAHDLAIGRMTADALATDRAHDEAMGKATADASTADRAHGDAMLRMTARASVAGRAHAAERVTLRSVAQSERTERERLETLLCLMDTELALAQRVNESLQAEDIRRPDLEVSVRQIPCSYIGGDYLQAALPRPDLLYLCVGDVAGHGVSAALVVSRIHGLVQRLILEQRAPERFLEVLDRAIIKILEHTPFFMTFAVYRVDLQARRIDYAMAGHPAQLLLRSDGSIEHLAAGNGLLGLGSVRVLGPVQPSSVSFEPGDTLVLFTDGLFEVTARDGDEMLGESGLLANLDTLAKSPPDEIASEILRRVVEFGRIGPFQDDVSLMVARFGPPASPLREGEGPKPETAGD